MVWQVIWSEKSVTQLKRMDKKTVQKIYDYVLDCAKEPFNAVTRLSNSPFYRMRVGNYRVILDLQQKKMVIFVITADHRKRVYD